MEMMMDIEALKLAVRAAELAQEDRKRELRAEMETALQPSVEQVRAAKDALYDAQDAIGIAALAARGIVIGETECNHKLGRYGTRQFEGKPVKVRYVRHSLYADGTEVVVSFVKKDGTLSDATETVKIDTLTPVPA